MRIKGLLSSQLSSFRTPDGRLIWQSLPWATVMGGLFGLSAGVLGAVFGVIVGHLIDEVRWTRRMRRLMREFMRTAVPGEELESVLGAAAAAVPAVFVYGATRGGMYPAAGVQVVGGYLRERYGTTNHARRAIELACDEAIRCAESGDLGSHIADRPEREHRRDEGQEVFLSFLAARPAVDERAEIVWLAGKLAGDGAVDAREWAEHVAQRLGVNPHVVVSAARRTGRLDERACMLLGVPQDADTEQVKRAYRRLAAQFHPDGARALEAHQRRQTEEAFIRIRRAYEQLMAELGEQP